MTADPPYLCDSWASWWFSDGMVLASFLLCAVCMSFQVKKNTSSKCKRSRQTQMSVTRNLQTVHRKCHVCVDLKIPFIFSDRNHVFCGQMRTGKVLCRKIRVSAWSGHCSGSSAPEHNWIEFFGHKNSLRVFRDLSVTNSCRNVPRSLMLRKSKYSRCVTCTRSLSDQVVPVVGLWSSGRH